jgi:hypothetical protein
MNQAITTGTWVKINESSNDYGHMRVFQYIKQRLWAHVRRSMIQAVIKGTKVPFKESRNDYGHLEPLYESSNDYGHMRTVQ